MSATIVARMGPADWLMLVVLSLLWGGSFFFVEVALEGLGPLSVVSLRVAVAALTLWAVVAALGIRPPRARAAWAAFLLMGLLNNVLPFSLIAWGQTGIGAGLAAILNASTPLFTVIVAGALLADERPSPAKVSGAVVGFVGVAVMLAPAALGALASDLACQVAVLAGALSYAFAGVYGRRFPAMGVPPLLAAAGQVTASALVLAPLALALERPFALPAPGARAWGAVIGLAVLSTALAYVLYFRLLARAGATNLLLVTFLIPVSAIALGGVFLGERLAPEHFAGMALIALGLALVDGRLLRRRAPAGAPGQDPKRSPSAR